MTQTISTLLFVLGIASALVGGVFLAFSDFIMRGLRAANATAAVAAMQAINRSVLRSIFLTLLLALVPASIAAGAYGLWQQSGATLALVLAGAITYIVAVFAVTVAGNVPMNERLDKMPPSDEETASYWQFYLRRWTRLNHVRTAGSIFAAVCYLLAAGT